MTASRAAARNARASALLLVAANLVPLAGVLALHWTVFSIFLLYWCENVVVGAFNVLKMASANPRSLRADVAKLWQIPLFVLHFGVFTAIHGLLVLTLFGPRGTPGTPAALLGAVRDADIWYGVLAIAVSHGFSFVQNYVVSGEFRRASAQQLSGQPYDRLGVLQAAILAAGFLTQDVGAPVLALVVLIGLKIAVDYSAHGRERRKFALAE